MATPVQVVPQGITSRDGSSLDMGCSSIVERDGVMVCDCNSQSYLVDGVSPDIDTSTSDWASQLVTVRRNEATADTFFDYVLLTFGFETNVSLTGIEMVLFHCPTMSIGAPVINVFLNEEYDLTFNTSLPILNSVVPSESRCDSLSSFTISETTDILYHVFHIIITFYNSDIDWVYVGEVRFLGSSDTGVTLFMVKDCSLCFSPFLDTCAADMTTLLSGTVEPLSTNGRCCIPIIICLVFHSLPQFLERVTVHVVRSYQQ